MAENSWNSNPYRVHQIFNIVIYYLAFFFLFFFDDYEASVLAELILVVAVRAGLYMD
jgi:hypothetical protein